MNHDALVAVARAVFEAAGGTPIDPDYVLPADIPLELSGEAVRARIFGHLASKSKSKK